MKGVNASLGMWQGEVGTEDNVPGDSERASELWFLEVQTNINSWYLSCNNVCLQEVDILLKCIQDGARADMHESQVHMIKVNLCYYPSSAIY